MPAEYHISRSDYIRIIQLRARPKRKRIAVFVILAALLMLLAIQGQPIVRAVAIAGLTSGMAAWLISLLLLPLLASRHYRKHRLGERFLSVELLERGLCFRGRQGEKCLLRWTQIEGWRQNTGFVLLYPNRRLFHIVPKALARQGFDIDALVARLRAEVGQPE